MKIHFWAFDCLNRFKVQMKKAKDLYAKKIYNENMLQGMT